MRWVNRLGLDVHDLLACLGLAAVLYGVAAWSRPAAWILGGALLVWLAIWPELRKETRR